jgi:hypothetical protein
VCVEEMIEEEVAPVDPKARTEVEPEAAEPVAAEGET